MKLGCKGIPKDRILINKEPTTIVSIVGLNCVFSLSKAILNRHSAMTGPMYPTSLPEDDNTMTYKFTIVLRRSSPNHAYTVRCVELPELITEGKSLDEALDNALDAFVSTLEIYEKLNQKLPAEIIVPSSQIENPKVQTKTPDPSNSESDLWFEATVPTQKVSPRDQSPLYAT